MNNNPQSLTDQELGKKPLDINLEDYVYLGRLGKTFGLKGAIRFHGIAEAETEAVYKLDKVYLSDLGERQILAVEAKGSSPVIFFAGAEHIDYAKALVGKKVYTARDTLPEIKDDSFYLEEIIGLAVKLDGQDFGEIDDIIDASAQDLVVILYQNQEYLVPLQADYVELTDEALLISNPPEGLFEL
ncbi:MAG: ribosome maturation factor RimM [Deinococcales bacterium]